ncbi:Peptidase C11, clostripain, partial [human gut metagenome]
MDELSEALADSVGAHMTKLEWIGFDACLMSSLEVASVLAPYADYMIAS